MFWGDQNNDKIVRSILNGTDDTTLVTGGMSCICKFNVMA